MDPAREIVLGSGREKAPPIPLWSLIIACGFPTSYRPLASMGVNTNVISLPAGSPWQPRGLLFRK